MYDGIRHFLVILPPLTILIGFTAWQVGKYLYSLSLKKRHFYFVFFILIVWLGYLQILVKDVTLHPYQIVYFNQLTGGIKGAYYQFDLDYWGQSMKEAAEWVNKNLPTGSTIRVPLMSHHFPVDMARFTFVDEAPDYKVILIRGMLKNWDSEEADYLRPKMKIIYSVNIEGAEILRIFTYKN